MVDRRRLGLFVFVVAGMVLGLSGCFPNVELLRAARRPADDQAGLDMVLTNNNCRCAEVVCE